MFPLPLCHRLTSCAVAMVVLVAAGASHAAASSAPVAADDSYQVTENHVLTVNYSFASIWDSRGTGDGQFMGPEAVAVDASGEHVYVADTWNYRIQKFTPEGSYLTQWGSYGPGDGQFKGPNAVAVDPTGAYVYVTELNNDRIQKFTADGTYLAQWGSAGGGVAVDAAGHVYVVETDNHRIQKFTADGTFITQWGSYGSGDGQFRSPHGVAIGANGTVYIADTGNDRIQKFTLEGTYLIQWGRSGSGDGQFDLPIGVAADPAGYVYVTELGNSRVQKLSGDGTFITQWGESGFEEGQFLDLTGVAVDDARGYVYTAETGNGRIQKFAPVGVLSNDHDTGGDPLAVVLDSDVSHGVLSLHEDGSFVYAPLQGFSGVDGFTYHVTDGTNSSNTATVTITVTATAVTSGFDDVPPGHVFAADIEWLAAEGISKGCNPPSNTLFCPNDTVTRGQMAAFLHRALAGALTPGPLPGFVDVGGSVFIADIEWLGAVGVTRGCNPPSHDMFCPNDQVTRGQMAALLVRALGYTAGAGSDRFTDDDESVFVLDIERLAGAGVTRGCNPPANDMYCPNVPVSRAQMSAFLHRALDS